MKNKYLTKCLCITLISAMVLASSAAVLAGEETGTFVSESAFSDQAVTEISVSETTAAVQTDPTSVPSDAAPFDQPPVINSDTETEEEILPTPGLEITPTPDAGVTPTPVGEVTPTPGGEVTPTPGSEVTPTPVGEVTPTPDPDATPTPGADATPTPEITVTPVPDDGNGDIRTKKVKQVVDGIDALADVEITLKHEARVQKLRTKYDALTAEEQSLVSNYELLVSYEAKISELKAVDFDDKENPDIADITDGTGTTSVSNVLIGTPVYYTNMVSNIHAGKEFYLNSLKSEYCLTFSDDFAAVMDSIEKEYKAKYKLTDSSDSRTDGVTTSADTLLVRNWQDILAIYVYEKSLEGQESFVLDASAKEDLAVIFEELNPVVRDKQNITHVSYGNYHINYYIKKNGIAKEDRAVLKKYVETDCKLLCATVTAAKGFVRQSVGDDVAEERVNVIAAAYSLVGKVGYFWGGKSTVLGEDPSWGTAARVTAAGSRSTGTVRAYGLDCSGFVTWAVINGYQNTSMQAIVGDGTSEQWVNARVVSEQDAQPGDLVFQRGPEAGYDNHVGILCGKTVSGDWIAVHCSSGKNGVTVGEAYSASFRYIRQPSFYPGKAEAAAMSETGVSSGADAVSVGNTLQDIIRQNDFISQNNTKENMIMDIISADTEDVEIFIGN